MMNNGVRVEMPAAESFESLGAFFGFFAIFFLVMMLISLVFYVIQAIALMKISENVGYDKGWLAWIPIANSFLMPILVEDEVHESMKGRFTLIYGISLIGSLFLSTFIPFASIIPAVLMYYAFFIIARWFSEHYVAHLVIAILTGGFSIAISLFRFRNRKKSAELT